jgi:hypothetical protein
MKIFLDDIKKIGWLNDSINKSLWGKNFLNLKKGFYFVFNYDLDESKSSIKVGSSKVLFEINDGIYRNILMDHIGYMKEPFDSSNYLFFSLLKNACTSYKNEDEKELTDESKKLQSQLVDLFVGYKAQDISENKRNLKQSIKGVQEINSSVSFSAALNNIFSINKAPVNGLCMVYDLLDQYTKNNHGKSIYGEYITKIVRAVKNPNGGLLPELADSTLRYMIIGEKAAKGDAELEIAKSLLRSGNDNYGIYLETGWFFNKYDSKWRKKISDETFYFDLQKLTASGDSFYYLSENYKYEDFKKLVSELASGGGNLGKAIANGYDGRVGSYISFEEAYKYYPQIKDLYSVFGLNMLPDNRYSFYFSPNIPNSLVLISGQKNNYDLEKIKYVALHEMQHYIQKIEGFGSGGNASLASLVEAVGGSAVKSFFISLSAFQKRFGEVASLIPIIEFKQLQIKLEKLAYKDYKIRYQNKFINVSQYYKQIVASLGKYVEDEKVVSENSDSISYYILTLFSMIEETNFIISEFVSKNIGKEYIEFFKQSLEQNKKTVERDERLTKLGWSPYDLYIMNFQTYESLIGEVESRFTQQTTKIPQELKDYFEFYTSETIDSSRVAVINNSIVEDDGKYFEAAIETFQDKYIIHLPERFSNSVNLLHETGHIIYDFVKDEVLINPDFATNGLIAGYENLEEYFCDSFVDYINRKEIDPMLTNDIGQEFKDFKDFDDIFEKVLYSKSEVDIVGLTIRLDFVMKILE